MNTFNLTYIITDGTLFPLVSTYGVYVYFKYKSQLKIITKILIIFNVVNYLVYGVSVISSTISQGSTRTALIIVANIALVLSDINLVYFLRFKRVQVQLNSSVEQTNFIISKINRSIRSQNLFTIALVLKQALYVTGTLFFYILNDPKIYDILNNCADSISIVQSIWFLWYVQQMVGMLNECFDKQGKHYPFKRAVTILGVMTGNRIISKIFIIMNSYAAENND